MALRNRINYSNVGLMAGPTPSYSSHEAHHVEAEAGFRKTKLRTLRLVQSASFDFSISRNEIKQIGGNKLAARKVVNQPNVGLSFGYFLHDGRNEHILGFNTAGDTAFLSGIQQTGQDRNFFFGVAKEQKDQFNFTSNFSGIDVLSFGNCFCASYSIEASANTFPTVSLDYVASNVKFDTNISGEYDPTGQYWGSGMTPAIDLQNGTKNNEWRYLLRSGDYSAGGMGDLGNSMPTGINYLKPSDIDLHLANPNIGGIKFSGEKTAHVHSLSINIPINRTDLLGLGSNYVYDRRPELPSLGQISIEATASEFDPGKYLPGSDLGAGLRDIFVHDENYDMEVIFNETDDDLNKTPRVSMRMYNAKLQSQSVSQGIGDNMTVSAVFTFECTPDQTPRTAGFTFSGTTPNGPEF